MALSRSKRKSVASLRTANFPPFEAEITQYVRVIRDHHKSGFGFSKTARSRFSDPDTPAQFGIVYAAQDLTTAIAEAVVRDRKDFNTGQMVLSYSEAVSDWRAVYFSSKAPLKLFNLTGAGTITFGIPTDVVRAKDQAEARKLSQAIHQNPSDIDGILYASRFTTGQCLALYDRSLSKLVIEQEVRFVDLLHEITPIYRAMNISIIKSTR